MKTIIKRKSPQVRMRLSISSMLLLMLFAALMIIDGSAEIPTEGEWQITYDAGGRVSEISGGGQSASYSYNDNGELTQASLDGSLGSVTTTYSVSTGSTPSIGGSVSGWGSYEDGQVANISANEEAGFVFVKWTGTGITGANETTNPLSVTVNGAKSLTAHFRLTEETAEYTNWISALYPAVYDAQLLMGTSDNDRDGWNNRYEYLMGFLPNNPSSGFRVKVNEVVGQNVALEYNRVRPMGIYSLYHSTNLKDWNLIDAFAPTLGEDDFPLNHEDAESPGYGYYRVQFSPEP